MIQIDDPLTELVAAANAVLRPDREPVVVREITIDEAASDPCFAGLLDGYANESALPELPRPNYQIDLYQKMESAGLFFAFAAYKGREMIGFVSLVATVLPHYGVFVASTESLYVAPLHRRGGPGRELLRRAEAKAIEIGSIGLFVNAQIGGRLDRVMSRSGYRESHRMYFKRFAL